MKQTTLEDLYYGNINPNEISFVRGSEYGKCFDKVTELSKSVCSQLSEEYINKMNELESAYTRILSETEREYFISGFKLGAKIMLEVYNGTKNFYHPTYKGVKQNEFFLKTKQFTFCSKNPLQKKLHSLYME
jgi:hypothetical protein